MCIYEVVLLYMEETKATLHLTLCNEGDSIACSRGEKGEKLSTPFYDPLIIGRREFLPEVMNSEVSGNVFPTWIVERKSYSNCYIFNGQN